MEWKIVAPFIHGGEPSWLQPFATRDGRSFEMVPAAYAHDRSRRVSGLVEWRDYLRHSHTAWRSMTHHPVRRAGLITVFPQLTICAALEKRLMGYDAPILAWCFNVGALYRGAKGSLARFCAEAVDRFVVHSTAEVGAYSRWLGLPESRFRFVPLQRPVEPITEAEDIEKPFVLAMGSANRDYRLLVSVVSELGFDTVIVAGVHALRGVPLPSHVRAMYGLTAQQCNELTQRARVCVVPVNNQDTASGQVTVIDSMMYGRPTIATRCVGTVDYVEQGRDGILVEPGSAAELKAALRALWLDADRRANLGAAARARFADRLSDVKAGAALDRILLELE